jgi:hypothetical protein
VVDGKVRFSPEQPTITKNNRVVNYIEIDKYMIEKAEEARDQNKVKNMADCMATENSWRLSENFERNCIEKN